MLDRLLGRKKSFRPARPSASDRQASHMPFVELRGERYYVVSAHQLSLQDLSGLPVCLKGASVRRPRVITRYPPPVFGGGEHEHVVIFETDGGVVVMYRGIALLRDGELVDVYGVVRDRKQIIAKAIFTESVEYSCQI